MNRKSASHSGTRPFPELGARTSDGPAARDEPYQEQNDRDDEQHVDEVAERVAGNHPEQPEDQQHECDCEEHSSYPNLSGTLPTVTIQLVYKSASGLPF